MFVLHVCFKDKIETAVAAKDSLAAESAIHEAEAAMAAASRIVILNFSISYALNRLPSRDFNPQCKNRETQRWVLFYHD